MWRSEKKGSQARGAGIAKAGRQDHAWRPQAWSRAAEEVREKPPQTRPLRAWMVLSGLCLVPCEEQEPSSSRLPGLRGQLAPRWAFQATPQRPFPSNQAQLAYSIFSCDLVRA